MNVILCLQLEPPLASDLVNDALLKAGEKVLDAACGTGIVARLALEHVGSEGSVTGLDLNPEMIAVARKISPTEISWCEASVEEIPFPDDTFDVILCQISFQFVNDKLKALREMYRVLRPGGRLILTTPGPASPIWEALADAFADCFGAEAGGFVKHVFSWHDETKMKQLLIKAQFDRISITKYAKTFNFPPSEDFLWQYIKSTPLGAFLEGVADGKLAELEGHALSKWRNFERDGHLTDQLPIMVSSAYK